MQSESSCYDTSKYYYLLPMDRKKHLCIKQLKKHIIINTFVWNSHHILNMLYREILQTYVWVVFIYGLETWAIKKLCFFFTPHLLWYPLSLPPTYFGTPFLYPSTLQVPPFCTSHLLWYPLSPFVFLVFFHIQKFLKSFSHFYKCRNTLKRRDSL